MVTGWVSPSRAAQEHRRFLDTLFANDQLGELGQRRSILRLLKQMFAQQPLGISAIPSMQRGRGLLNSQLGLGCGRLESWREGHEFETTILEMVLKTASQDEA
jgi:hypothetical protein